MSLKVFHSTGISVAVRKKTLQRLLFAERRGALHVTLKEPGYGGIIGISHKALSTFVQFFINRFAGSRQEGADRLGGYAHDAGYLVVAAVLDLTHVEDLLLY